MPIPPADPSRARRRAVTRRQIRRRAAALIVALAVVAGVVVLGSRGHGTQAAAAVAAPSAAPAGRAAAPARREHAPANVLVRFAAVGDTTFGWDAGRPSGDGSAWLAGARSLLVGDVVLGNLETTLTTGGSGKCGAGSTSCYSFRVPPAYAHGLAESGFTVMNLANNHANDYGATGQRDTLAALGSAGLRWTGKPGQITYVTVGPARVAIIGLAPYPWAQDALNLRAARAIVRRAASLADLVFVTAHIGGEGSDHTHVRPGPEVFLGEQRGNPIALAHAVIDAGADLVAMHGPHVLRALEWYRGRLIDYSLGNFSAYGNLSTSGLGGVSVVLQATLHADGRLAKARLVPLRLVGQGAPAADPAGTAIGIVRQLSREDMGARAPRLTSSGEIVPP